MGKLIPIERRIRSHYVERGPDECWEWLGKRNAAGYGLISAGGVKSRELRAHRVMYELHVGPIPNGLVLHHTCENRGCVNPAHLTPTGRGDNVNRGPQSNASKTHCKRGHEFTPENTYHYPNRSQRACRECHRLYELARRRAL